ncbi:MAG: DNA-deoxyinosine glycosylase [Clostridiales bacterium]|nr:DNA-deoxyinosine glycosylase [Clostridiales bacterium]
MGEYQRVTHSFEPVYDENSKILILGSLPSIKSREEGFYYGHPRNRFWKVLSRILKCTEPVTIEEKKSMLLIHGIALWDVIASCEIKGSSDSSIKNVIPADILGLLRKTFIKKIYVNGKTAGTLYEKYVEPLTAMPCTVLPSTSPANAAYSLERLLEKWTVIFY